MRVRVDVPDLAGKAGERGQLMVIDLGVVREAPEAVLGSRRGPRGWRWFAVFGLLAVLLAGGPEPVRGHLAEATVATAGKYVFSGPTGLYVVDGDTIRNYRLPGGEVGWQVTVPAQGRAQSAFLIDGTVLVTGDGADSRTSALDAETGRLRWERAGSPNFVGDGGLVLLTDPRPGVLTVRYEVVELATGAVRWELTDLAGEAVFHGGDRFVRWSLPDQVEVRDMGTGRVVTTGVVPPWDDDLLRSYSGSGVQVVGGMMLVPRYRGGRPVADAYDLDRLVLRWTADLDLSSMHVSECGDLLCVDQASAAGGVHAIEPETGRVRWSDSGAHRLERVGSVMVAYGMLEQPPRIRILDPANGNLRADLGRWEIGWPYGDDGRVVATRPSPDGGALIAELDVNRGKVRILGVTRDAFACHSGWALVICNREGDNTGIWYPRDRADR
ncbi:hypothetical protein GCM10023170_065070 [Phytohabitans houttuyneae]|uniref:Pyrrolo-quinoline quinone repeat domain-containing protein n=1 Tax=Phytohabitans houttuyneae TaxID=1076126 RepID=A0A6V8KHF8_9ACTN|nr:hypothetical protein Phou_060180 [Phytohabitans houttuyneae]